MHVASLQYLTIFRNGLCSRYNVGYVLPYFYFFYKIYLGPFYKECLLLLPVKAAN